jgi:hypothetical protein
MFGVLQILVSTPASRRVLAIAASAALLAACGQKGPLFLPTEDAGVRRGGPLETPSASTAVVPAGAASTPTTGTAAPVRNP